VTEIFAAALVIASLLFVVAGHAFLAAGQVRLADLQGRLASEQTLHRERVLAVAQLENPQRIVQTAQRDLGLVPSSDVTQLPAVSLTTPLPVPHLTALPPPAADGTSATSGTTTTDPAGSADVGASPPAAPPGQ
jgi:hypothetical protein